MIFQVPLKKQSKIVTNITKIAHFVKFSNYPPNRHKNQTKVISCRQFFKFKFQKQKKTSNLNSKKLGLPRKLAANLKIPRTLINNSQLENTRKIKKKLLCFFTEKFLTKRQTNLEASCSKKNTFSVFLQRNTQKKCKILDSHN